jgi:hypothetical protein
LHFRYKLKTRKLAKKGFCKSLLCINNYSIEVSENTRPPENPPEKDEDDKVKFQEYILPLFMDFAKDNKIDPMVCYEVAHELELSLIEDCLSKGFNKAEIEVHKHIAEMDWKTRKEEMMGDKGK